MALLPTPSTGRLLRWKSDGTLENVTISDLLDSIASATEPSPGTQKYWIDTSLVTGVGAAVSGVSMQVRAGTPSIVVGTSAAIDPVSASMAAAGGTPTVAVTSVSSVSVVPAGASMAAAAGTATVGTTVALSLAGASMAATGYAPSVSTITSREVNPSGVSMAATAGTPTVSTGSTAVAVSDNFGRANGGLGTNWTTISSMSAPSISNAQIEVQTGTGAYWGADSFASNQYATVRIVSGAATTDVLIGVGPAIRIQSGAKTFYMASDESWDNQEDANANVIRLRKCVAGTYSTVGTPSSYDPGSTGPYELKIEAVGTTIKVYTAASGTTSWTERISYTDSSAITGGAAGFVANDPAYTLDYWTGGDA